MIDLIDNFDLNLWHYKNWEAFDNLINSTTLNINNFHDDGRTHQLAAFFRIDSDGAMTEYNPMDPEDHYFVKLVKGNEFFILPKRFTSKFPLQPKSTMDVKLKKSDSVVWKYITEITEMKIPEKMFWSFRDSIDMFNPIVHSEPDVWTWLKIWSWSIGTKIALCGEVGSGKNANQVLLRHIMPGVSPKVEHPTKAKFYQTMYFNSIINCDEVTSWTNEEVAAIEALMAASADSTPVLDKFSKDANRSMEELHFGEKSSSFTFNRPDELKSEEHRFENKFKNPGMIMDRFPRLLVCGKVQSNIVQPTLIQAKENVQNNLIFYQKITANFAYWRHNYAQHLHHYDTSKTKFKRRQFDNLKPMFDRLDLYSESQKEFDAWMKFTNELGDNYLRMLMNKSSSCANSPQKDLSEITRFTEEEVLR